MNAAIVTAEDNPTQNALVAEASGQNRQGHRAVAGRKDRYATSGRWDGPLEPFHLLSALTDAAAREVMA
ncbi:MAG: hypothetical protein V3S01_02935 [Dehalococcoidia bacterium]